MLLNPPSFSPATVRWCTIVLAAGGAWVFHAAGFILPFLFGPMTICLIAGLVGVPVRDFTVMSQGARSVIGLTVGASITPALLLHIPQMAFSLILVLIYTVIMGTLGVLFFWRVCRFDPITSYYAAIPGGLQDMVFFGIEAGGNPRILSLIHATRILLLVTLTTLVLTQVYEVELGRAIGTPVETMTAQELALMTVTAIGGWQLAQRTGLFGAPILGPLILAGLLSLSGLLNARPPAEAIMCVQFFVGIGIGVYYAGLTLRELRLVVTVGVVYSLILTVLAAIFSLSAVTWAGVSSLEAFLAFVPGGQAEMTVLAIVTRADVGVVVAHHLTRVVLVITCAPLIIALLMRYGAKFK